MTRKKLKKRDVERLENTSIAVPLLDNLSVGPMEGGGPHALECLETSTDCYDSLTHCNDGQTNVDTAACREDATLCSGSGTVCTGPEATFCNEVSSMAVQDR